MQEVERLCSDGHEYNCYWLIRGDPGADRRAGGKLGRTENDGGGGLEEEGLRGSIGLLTHVSLEKKHATGVGRYNLSE